MTDKKREENQQQPNEEVKLEDLQPAEEQTENVKGGMKGEAPTMS